MAGSSPQSTQGRGVEKCSGRARGGMLQAALQAIEISETLLPALVAGLHIDMPGAGQNARFGAPIARQLQGPGGADGTVVVGTDHLAWKRQQVARNRRKVAQGGSTGRAFD